MSHKGAAVGLQIKESTALGIYVQDLQVCSPSPLACYRFAMDLALRYCQLTTAFRWVGCVLIVVFTGVCFVYVVFVRVCILEWSGDIQLGGGRGDFTPWRFDRSFCGRLAGRK